MPTVDVLDSNIHYEESGSGTAVVLLHGNPGSSHTVAQGPVPAATLGWADRRPLLAGALSQTTRLVSRDGQFADREL
jgi:pimeloyl-ACP methyl ester carboxylesterase